jgi:hypothetical protein
MKSINSDYLKTIVLLLFIYFAQSTFAAEKCALSSQLTDSSKKVHCLDKFEFSKRKYSNLRMPLISATRSSNCWSLAIPNEASCKNIIGFSAQDPLWCMDPGVRRKNNQSAVSMCQEKGCKCSLVIDANDIVDEKLFFSYVMGETDLVALSNTGKEVKESIGNKPDLDNSQSEKNQSNINAEKEKQAQQELKLAQEAKAKEDAVFEARQKAQQELQKSQEAEASAAALAKLKQEEYEKEKQNAATKARVLEEIKADAYAKEKAILEAKAKAQADLKAEEIAKKQAEEQAKAQAIVDEKNRVAAAKAAAVQAKKNREQEIAEEKRKIAESQRKIEELQKPRTINKNSKSALQLIKTGELVTCIITMSENYINGVGINRVMVSKSNPVIHEIIGNELKAYSEQGTPKVAYDGAELFESTLMSEDGKRFIINTFLKKGEINNKITFFREVDTQNKFIGGLMQWIQFGDNESHGRHTGSCQSKQDSSNAKVETSKKITGIPLFTLACSTGSGSSLYRIVSNGIDIYFGSVLDERQGADKGDQIQVSEREIKFTLIDAGLTTLNRAEMVIYRDNLSVRTKQFVDKTKKIFPPDGYHITSYSCELINDDTLFDTLKNKFETELSATKEMKTNYDNRPNKL